MSANEDPRSLKIIETALEKHRHVIIELENQAETISLIGEVIFGALGAGKKIMTYGNGGSAADAQHMVAELVGRFTMERPALPAIALTTNSSNLTAIGNDYSWDQVFARQLEALGQPGDVAIGISTSGNSENVLATTRRARDIGLMTVGLTGRDGGELRELVDHCLCVGVDTARAQEGHGIAIHMICEIVENRLFQPSSA